VVRYPSAWFVRYDFVTRGDVELYNYDYTTTVFSPQGKPLPLTRDALRITIAGHGLPVELETPPRGVSTSFMVAGSPAVWWEVDSRDIVIRVYNQRCYYSIYVEALGAAPQGIVDARAALTAIIDSLRFMPSVPIGDDREGC
jgi:hypothetical protein